MMARVSQKRHARRIFEATLDSFCTATVDASNLQKTKVEAIRQNWQSLIDNDLVIEKLSVVQNFESLVGYQREFNTSKLTVDEYISKAMQRSAEIDLAIHIIRKNDDNIVKLTENGLHKVPDFVSGINANNLYESKFLEIYTGSALKDKAIEGLTQIQEYATIKKLDVQWGRVHIFTYDAVQNSKPLEVQEYIQQLVSSLKRDYPFHFEIVLQIYDRSYYQWSSIYE